jgi:hypothetical protein
MYLNGMIAVFQLLFSLILCVPSSLASDPPVPIEDLPQNLFNGLKCFVGVSSVECKDDEDDGECYPDNCNPNAPTFVACYLIFNQLYNLLILLILKYGSANILWMVCLFPFAPHSPIFLMVSQAMTLMVPLGNVVRAPSAFPPSRSCHTRSVLLGLHPPLRSRAPGPASDRYSRLDRYLWWSGGVSLRR